MRESPPPDGRTAKWILLLTIFLVLMARLASGQETATQKPNAGLDATAKQASVEVLVDDHLDGSGWFADREGLFFTAAHVVGSPGRRIEILSPAVGRRKAHVVAVDLGHDLVLLQAEPDGDDYPALKLAEKTLPPGGDVFLLGAPLFRHAVMLRGMTAREGTVFGYYADKYVETIHIAATVQGGMSGGPWLNARGEVIGTQSGVMSQNGIPIGVANAVPLDAIRRLLKSRRNAATPTIGAAVEETWQQHRNFLDRFPPRTEGLVVKILNKDRAAARAGLKQWDLIIAADGHDVRLCGELLRIIRAKKPGESVKLTVTRPDGAGTYEADVPLGKLEVGWPQK